MNNLQRQNYSFIKKIWYKIKGFLNSQAVEKVSNQKMAIIVGMIVIVIVACGIVLFQHDKVRTATTLEGVNVLATDMPGWWYNEYFDSSVCTSDACKSESDPDQDKLTNAQEFYYNSNPVKVDTNENGKTDGEDVALGVDPSRPGDVTFEQVLNEEEIFGESMLYKDTVTQVFAKDINPNNIEIKLAVDEELEVIDDNSDEAQFNYLLKIKQIVYSYFDSNSVEYIKNAVAMQSEDELADIQMRSGKIAQDLKKTEVPSKILTLHKYLIRYFELLPKIIITPSQEQIWDSYNPTSNLWADNVREFMVLMDRAQYEQKKLGIALPIDNMQGE